MRVDDTHFRCPRCGVTRELTPANFYIGAGGKVSGYCKAGCHADWQRSYVPSAQQRERRRIYLREYHRRRYHTPPERYRVGRPQEDR